MVYCDEAKGIPIQDIWLNYRDSINQAQKTTGYPTEKNFDMLKMIIAASSNEDDIVLDCFAGSGTTLGAAFELKRNWIGVDQSPESLKAILKRFVTGLEVYGDYVNKEETTQLGLDLEKKCHFSIYTTNNLLDDILNRLYKSGRINEDILRARVVKGTINEEEFKFITGKDY